MLKANKSLWFEKLFAVYNRNLFERKFDSIAVANLDFLKEDKPTIIYANHSSWWDGLLAFQISQAIRADSYVMMEEKQLKNLFLFRRLGAFSVVRENARQAVESLNYAVDLLRENTQRTLWIFPQGEILPHDARPLKFYRGLAKIVERLGNCSVAPIALRYEFLGKFKPQIFVRCGETMVFTAESKTESKTLTPHFEKNLIELLDELKRDITFRNTENYKKIL